jgi:O-antigen/teichoic acid export membrane protein
MISINADNHGIRHLIILILSLCVSFSLLIVAGVVGNSWLPMLNLAAVVLVPIAVILSEVIAGGSSTDYDEVKQAWSNLGTCFFAVILISMVGLPLVLLHTNQLPMLAFWLWIGSTIVTFGAGIYYWFVKNNNEY